MPSSEHLSPCGFGCCDDSVVVDSLFVVAPNVCVCVLGGGGSLLCYAVISFAINSLRIYLYKWIFCEQLKFHAQLN